MVGRVIGGRYEVLAQLGSGGMAHVYRARCRILNRVVTLKLLRAELAADKEFVERFGREAQAVASLSHPNIVNIYDVGEEEGVPYLVMEYVEGTNLKELIRRRGAFPVAEALNLAVQICAALAHAHERGIIHRDIKPHNILVTPAGRVKVADFGLARLLFAPNVTVTQSGSVVGSVYYLSPEQARGEEVDARSDIYSLGVVLYEMLTGEVPFRGENPISVALKHLQEPPLPPRRLNPGIPREVEEVVLRCLAKEPEERFASARELQGALLALLEEYGEDLLPAGEKRGKRLRPWAKLLLGLAVFLLLAAGAWGLARLFLPGEVVVPGVTGMRREAAVARLEEAGLRPEVVAVFDARVPAGVVIKQSPLPGTRTRKGRTVQVWVSKGPRLVWLPDVRGLHRQFARVLLAGKGFAVREVAVASEKPAGIVVTQDPPGDRFDREGATVTLGVSEGSRAEEVVVPSLLGLTPEEAGDVLERLGLALGSVREEERSDQPPGRICAQDPSPGTPVAPGTPVNVTCSRAPSGARRVPLELVLREQGTVRIIVQDAQGTRLVYEAAHQAGERLVQEAVVFPPGKVQVYFRGQLLEEYRVE